LIFGTFILVADCWDDFLVRNQQIETSFNRTSKVIGDYFRDRMKELEDALENGEMIASVFDAEMEKLQKARSDGRRANYERYSREAADSYEQYIDCPDDLIS
jgi:hypothetical protein